MEGILCIFISPSDGAGGWAIQTIECGHAMPCDVFALPGSPFIGAVSIRSIGPR